MPHRVVALALPGVHTVDPSSVVQLVGHPPTLEELRKRFTDGLGTTPTAYRRTFRTAVEV